MCVCVWVGDQNDMKLGKVAVLDSLSKPIDFGFKRSEAHGHHFKLLAPLRICETDAATKLKFCAQIKNYAGMWHVSHIIIPCEKFTPTYIIRYHMKT